MSFTQQPFTFRAGPSTPWPSDGIYDGELCDECAKLDLELSFARAYALYEGARRAKNNRRLQVYRSDTGPAYLGHFYYVTSLSNRLSRASHCKLCDFLIQMITEPNKGTYKLLAICSSESYLFEPLKIDGRGRVKRRPWDRLEHNVFMAVVPEVPLIPKTGVPLRWFETDLPRNGSIYRLTQNGIIDESRITRPRELSPKADFRLMRAWLNFCRQTHDCCSPRMPAGATLPGFRAINCAKTPPVVEVRPWSERYVALSYVWGPPSGDWPQTILDAVKVTRRFGEQYLWVDRLCIDQSNLQEKQFLISKMDAIYNGAEFTIVAAAGDARTGLPGVTTTPRKKQPRVELTERCQTAGAARVDNLAPFELLGVTEQDYSANISNDREWLDPHRHGMGFKTKIDMGEFLKDEGIMDTYDIPREHLRIFQDFAEDFGNSIDEHMGKMKLMAERMGIPMKELIPHLLGQAGNRAGMAAGTVSSSLPQRPATDPSKPEKPLPPGKVAGQTILISVLEDPRITIRSSEWATRGWTYQEGVLSNRCLVFTERQVYWECAGMVMNESIDQPLFRDPSGTRMADYMLSGIFDGDFHRVPELQYGFKTSAADAVAEQVTKLDSHIRAFTSRNLSYDSDSLNAFLGVAARYSTDRGLSLLLGIPVWTGLFADGKPGLQHTFALSISAWTHAAEPVEQNAEMDVAHCPRRAQFPSWTWAGWKGRADFSASNAVDEEEEPDNGDTGHVDFFEALTSAGWCKSIDKLWSAEMMLHTADGGEGVLLTGRAPVVGMGDPNKTWLLTIREPMVLRHMYLMHSVFEGEWRRLVGKLVQVHLSVAMTEAELTAGHKSGELVTVLVLASTVPFICNGMARFLILRKADAGGTRWERIGRLAMSMEEWEMEKCRDTMGMIDALPVKKFGRDIVLI